MPDESNLPASDAPVTAPEGDVTDDGLDSLREAFKDVIDEEAAPAEKAPEGKTEKPAETVPSATEPSLEEHKERSALGRKLKAMEERQAASDKVIEELRAALIRKDTAPPPETGLEGAPEIITTPDDVISTYKLWQQQEQKKELSYRDQVAKAVMSHAAEDGDLHGEILDEIVKNHNVKISDNPVLNAELIHSRAAKAVALRKLAEKSGLPARKTAESAPGKPAASSGATPPESKRSPIDVKDKAVQSFIDFCRNDGDSEEKISSWLSG
jgi:hypothetical protein